MQQRQSLRGVSHHALDSTGCLWPSGNTYMTTENGKSARLDPVEPTMIYCDFGLRHDHDKHVLVLIILFYMYLHQNEYIWIYNINAYNANLCSSQWEAPHSIRISQLRALNTWTIGQPKPIITNDPQLSSKLMLYCHNVGIAMVNHPHNHHKWVV